MRPETLLRIFETQGAEKARRVQQLDDLLDQMAKEAKARAEERLGGKASARLHRKEISAKVQQLKKLLRQR